MNGRWKVACINWSSEDWAPHAMAYLMRDGVMVCDRYFDTWREAFDWADRMARR